VRQLLVELDETLRAPAAFSPSSSDRTFRVAANDYAVAAVVSPLLQRLQQRAPRVTLEVLALEDAFDKRLADEDYDLAIRDRWSLRSSRRSEALFTEEYVCIARRNHPRLSRTPTLDEFLAEAQVLIAPQGRSQGVVDRALEPLKRTRHVAVTLPHFLAAPAVISRTDYVMTIARRVAQRFLHAYKLRIFPPPFPLRGFEVAMAWQARGEADAGIAWLKDQIRQSTD
jgi:DNA-binding transcriptional LysR family regulator